MTLCVLVCFVEFYVFVFDEVDMRGPKIVYRHIRVGNVLENIFRTNQGSLRKDPSEEAKAV